MKCQKTSLYKFWIAIIGLVIVIIFFIIIFIVGCNSNKSISKSVKNHTKSTKAVPTEQPTTIGNYTEAEKDTDFTLKDMTFTIPKNWEYEYHEDSNWVELVGPNGGNVQISVKNEDLQDSIDDVYKIIDDFRSANINVINSDKTESNVGGEKATMIIYSVQIGSNNMINTVYVFQKDDYTYTLQNSYYEKEAIEDYSEFIVNIVNSVKFR